jgi:uncharacterized protein YjbI with pentapeptide repeats
VAGDAPPVPRNPAKPRVPARLDPATAADHDLVDEASFDLVGFAGLDLSGRAADAVRWERCRFDRTTLAATVLERAAFADCVVEHCDWANLGATKSSLSRVEVSLSRLTGLHWVDGALRDVTFRECRMDLATFRFTGFTRVAFVDCNLTRADFTNADLRGAAFTGCDLTAAQFAQAKADGARFTRCELAGAGSVASLRGAVISAADLVALSYTLAAALGITIDRT